MRLTRQGKRHRFSGLEGFFDFYFVQPAKLEKKRDALNKKLKEAGKPPLKGAAREK